MQSTSRPSLRFSRVERSSSPLSPVAGPRVHSCAPFAKCEHAGGGTYLPGESASVRGEILLAGGRVRQFPETGDRFLTDSAYAVLEVNPRNECPLTTPCIDDPGSKDRTNAREQHQRVGRCGGEERERRGGEVRGWWRGLRTNAPRRPGGRGHWVGWSVRAEQLARSGEHQRVEQRRGRERGENDPSSPHPPAHRSLIPTTSRRFRRRRFAASSGSCPRCGTIRRRR